MCKSEFPPFLLRTSEGEKASRERERVGFFFPLVSPACRPNARYASNVHLRRRELSASSFLVFSSFFFSVSLAARRWECSPLRKTFKSHFLSLFFSLENEKRIIILGSIFDSAAAADAPALPFPSATVIPSAFVCFQDSISDGPIDG